MAAHVKGHGAGGGREGQRAVARGALVLSLVRLSPFYFVHFSHHIYFFKGESRKIFFFFFKICLLV